LNHTNQKDQIDQKDQMNQIPAMRRSMCDYTTWTHFLGAAMFIPGG